MAVPPSHSYPPFNKKELSDYCESIWFGKYVSDPAAERNSCIVMAIDPGVRNLALAILFFGDINYPPVLIGTATWNIKSRETKVSLGDAMENVMSDINLVIRTNIKMKYPSQDIIIIVEYQPPLNTRENPNLVRENTYVEAFITGFSRADDLPLVVIAPAAVKKWLTNGLTEDYKRTLPSGYKGNKKMVIDVANQIFGTELKSDHICDAALLGVYWRYNNHYRNWTDILHKTYLPFITIEDRSFVEPPKKRPIKPTKKTTTKTNTSDTEDEDEEEVIMEDDSKFIFISSKQAEKQQQQCQQVQQPPQESQQSPPNSETEKKCCVKDVSHWRPWEGPDLS
jgi:hypothetical protein